MATVVAATTALALGAAAPALAQPEPIPWTGQGTNEDGTCESFEEDDAIEVPEGQQAWHFILNQQGDPENATMDAEFDDGTIVTGVSPTKWTSSVAHFYILTDEGAALISATAYPAGDQGKNPQFVVSHCVEGEVPPTSPPPTTPPPSTPPETPPTEAPTTPPTEEPTTPATPKPVPTSVPAGYGDADNGTAGTIGMLAFATALALGGAALVSRRFLKDN